jgi:hypothetical protein
MNSYYLAGIPATAAAVVWLLAGPQTRQAEKLPAHTERELFGTIDVLRFGRQCLRPPASAPVIKWTKAISKRS